MLLTLYLAMAEPTDRRSTRSRKPKIHFDEIVQSSGPSKPSTVPKKPSTAPKKSSIASKTSAKPLPAEISSNTPSETPTHPPILDLIEDLCGQTAKLDIKAKKKAKSEEIRRLSKLGFQGVLEEIKPLKEVEYEPIVLRNHQAPKVNILSNIDTADPLALLDLFILLAMYITIAENTNLYAISKNALIASTKSNSRY